VHSVVIRFWALRRVGGADRATRCPVGTMVQVPGSGSPQRARRHPGGRNVRSRAVRRRPGRVHRASHAIRSWVALRIGELRPRSRARCPGA